jgi:hypothetical protein
VNAYCVRILYHSTDYYGTVPPQTASVQTIVRATSAYPASTSNNDNSSGEGMSISDRISIAVGLSIPLTDVPLLAAWHLNLI